MEASEEPGRIPSQVEQKWFIKSFHMNGGAAEPASMRILTRRTAREERPAKSVV
jgi:hypothetical protein